MSFLNRGVFTFLAAAAFAVPSLSPREQAPAPPIIQAEGAHAGAIAPVALYSPTAIEFYLANDVVGWIRPGVKVKVNSVTVPADKKPVLDVTITDSLDQPLDRLGQVTPGPVAPGFILSEWDPAKRYFTTYTMRTRSGVTNPSSDQNGAWTDLAVGHYTYKFATAIPASHDPAKTLTIGVYARRTMADIIGKDYYADNVFVDFRTDSGTVTEKWDSMDVAKSCNRCHDPLGLHGGTRRTVKLCMQCHNLQVKPDAASGESFDGKVYFHKLHMGEHLPSVVAGGSYEAGGDFSTVAWPGNNNRAPYDCTTCHETSASQKEIWYTRPSTAVCGSCHDDVNFTTGENHPAGPAMDDTCASCHKPVGDMEFDASIQGAHTIPEKSKQLAGLNASIVSFSDMAPGKKPTVVFKITNGDGSKVDGTKLSTFSPILAGPTTSYDKPYWREDARSKAVYDATAGTTTYTFQNAVPAGSTGTWVLSADIYRSVNLKRGDGKADIAVRECAMNPIQYAAVDGKAVVARRSSVALANCNKCHGALALHGGQRQVIEECVICHNPMEDDSSRRPSSAGKPESVSMQRMIHRIHTGEELTQDFTVYGFGGSLNNYNEVRYPGDRRNCLACHVNAASYGIPLPTTADAVVTQRDYFSPQGPATASCLGCHDTRDAAAHAYLNTAPFGEACGACHGTGNEWGVDKVHAR